MLFLDHLEGKLAVGRLERQLLANHTVKDDSARPQIYWRFVAYFLENFRGHIGWCAAAVEGKFFGSGKFRKSEIGDFDAANAPDFVSCRVRFEFNENVFRFEVAVDNSALVEIANAK